MPISSQYIKELPEIYRDLLAAYPQFDATRKTGYGLSFQSLYSALNGKYTPGEIRMACEEMARGGAVEIRNEIFANPTPLGAELIAAITGKAAPAAVPRFIPPEQWVTHDREAGKEGPLGLWGKRA